jgi:hypothetical protein
VREEAADLGDGERNQFAGWLRSPPNECCGSAGLADSRLVGRRAGEHWSPLGFEPCKKIVPLPGDRGS